MWIVSNGPDGASSWLSRDLRCGRWKATSACGRPTYVRIYEFWPVLDDHGMFQSIRVINDIHLHLFDMCKGPGWREVRVRYRDDVYFKCRLVPAPAEQFNKSPFYVSLALLKVSLLNTYNEHLTDCNFRYFSSAPLRVYSTSGNYKSGREGWEFGEIEDPEASGAGWNSARWGSSRI